MARKRSSKEPDSAEAPETKEANTGQPQPGMPNVIWDDGDMTTTFANVVNVSSTREEVTIFFGTNQTWNPSGSDEVKVRLSDRIILTPFAAKRLWLLMGGLLREYEKRYGVLDLSVGGGTGGN